ASSRLATGWCYAPCGPGPASASATGSASRCSSPVPSAPSSSRAPAASNPCVGITAVRAPAPPAQPIRGEASEGGRSPPPSYLACVGVEAAARLPSEVTRDHHALEKRRRRVARLAELLEHHLGDVHRGVEPDEVQERTAPWGRDRKSTRLNSSHT